MDKLREKVKEMLYYEDATMPTHRVERAFLAYETEIAKLKEELDDCYELIAIADENLPLSLEELRSEI